jgi:hypothetical protein
VDHGCRQDHSGGSQRWFLQTMLFTLLGRHIMSSQAVLAPVIDPTVIASLFGTSQFSLALLDFVTSLHPPSSSTIQPGKNSVFPDCTYESHPTLGLSLCFASGTSPSSSSRCLDAVDIFNPPLHPPPKSRSRRKAAWEGCSPPPLPIPFTFPSTTITVPPFKPGEEAQVIDRLAVLEVTSGTTGREFVGAFGEPSRKGGGTGWVPVFMEWRRVELIPASSRDGMNGIADSGKEEEKETVEVGIMVELGDQGAGVLTDEQRKNGLGGVWDQAARWEWETLKPFKPSSRPGKKDG